MWIKKPRVTTCPFRKKKRCESRKIPRIVAGNPKPRTAQDCFEKSAAFVEQDWQCWNVKDTEKGPKIVEVKHAIVYPQNANGLPGEPHHLIIVPDVISGEVKYVLSNAPSATRVDVLLKVAFAR